MTKPDRTYKGQDYWCDILKLHTRKDGTATTLLEWKSHCADCGELFSFWRPVRRAKFDRTGAAKSTGGPARG